MTRCRETSSLIGRRAAALERSERGRRAAKVAREAMDAAAAASISIAEPTVGDRIAAFFIDMMLALLALVPLAAASETLRPLIGDMEALVLLGFAWAVLVIAGSALLEASRWRATPGKMLCGLAVGTVEGGRVRFRKALVRNLLKFAVPLPLSAACLLLWRRNRAWHDRVSGTAVVKRGGISPAPFVVEE